jgi:hypothetical protein
MFLERAMEVFEEILISRELVEQDKYKDLVKKSRNSFLTMSCEVEKFRT